jgi:hypothetical protein
VSHGLQVAVAMLAGRRADSGSRHAGGILKCLAYTLVSRSVHAFAKSLANVAKRGHSNSLMAMLSAKAYIALDLKGPHICPRDLCVLFRSVSSSWDNGNNAIYHSCSGASYRYIASAAVDACIGLRTWTCICCGSASGLARVVDVALNLAIKQPGS